MSGQLLGQVVKHNFGRTPISIDIILGSFVNYRKLNLPLMADCTELLHEAGHRAVADMSLKGERVAYAETFRPSEFQRNLQDHVDGYHNGQLPVNVPRLEMRAQTAAVRAPAPEPVPF